MKQISLITVSQNEAQTKEIKMNYFEKQLAAIRADYSQAEHKEEGRNLKAFIDQLDDRIEFMNCIIDREETIIRIINHRKHEPWIMPQWIPNKRREMQLWIDTRGHLKDTRRIAIIQQNRYP